MEVGKSTGGGEASSSSSKPASICYSFGGRLVFDIELTPGETTIVSWKKLLRDANKAKPPAAAAAPTVSAPAAPSLPLSTAQPVPVVDQVTKSKPEDAPPSNRFSAVVEKIERLYVGKQSSDEEELDDVPDDDQYDTEDSFIDDTELDEYFQVDKATTKHNGFFVNKGKLERIDESTSSANHQQKRPRKKREKSLEDKGDDHGPNKLLKLGHARMKVAARTAPFAGRSSNSQSSVAIECFPDGQLQHSLSGPMGSLTNKPADCGIKTEHSSYSRISTRDDSVFPLKTDNCETQKTGITKSNVKDASEFSDARYQNQEKNVVKQFQTAAKRLTSDNNERELSTKKRKDENSGDKLPDLNLPVSNDLMQQPVENTSMHLKDVPSIKPKGTVLERAIRELEKVVVESRPQKMEVEDTDSSSMAIKRRLPREVKQKLAKVARLAQSSQGRISEELINRLMSILGHFVQLRTLKRNLREMVLLGLSAKREKADRFQQIKTEVLEMIKLQGHSKSMASKQQDGATDDFQVELGAEDKGVLKGKISIDNAIEDKICDLYDLYVQGMDEDKGPQMRKLYVELAELWPNGSMDNSGIKSAVERAKGRRRELHNREKVEEKARRKNLPTPKSDMVRGESGSTGQSLAFQGPTNSSTLASSSRMMNSNMDTSQQLSSPIKLSDQSLISSQTDLPREEKLENLTFPMLKEQMKQQHREVEKRVKKLSLKPEKGTQKPHKQQTSGQLDDPSNQLPSR